MKIFIFTSLLLGAQCFAIDAAQMVKNADRARSPIKPFSMNVRITDDDGTDKKTSVYRVQVKDPRVSLVEQIEPERARGRKLLLKDFDMWLYTPNMKRATRISMEQKLTGEVSNGDLSRTNFAEDYNAKILSEEKINSKTAVKLELLGNNKSVTYQKIHYWVDKATNAPLKAQFFALSGKLLKEAVYLDLKPELGGKMIHTIRINDALQKSKLSVMTFTAYKFEKYSDAQFSKESLDQD
jgi:outer membrane lipoprotein-sorting protein